MKQITIVQIDNGWVVSTPEMAGNITGIDVAQQQLQMQIKNHFCHDFDEVVECLRDVMVIS